MYQKPISKTATIAYPIFGVVSIILLWQFALPFFGVPKYIAPTPLQILQVFLSKWSVLKSNFIPTFLEAIGGFLFGNIMAVILAVIFAYSRFIRLAYFPAVLFFNTIPILALSPIIILIFGLGMTPKIIIAAVICFFPTLINMIRGLTSATHNERELLHILSATPIEAFWHLHWKRALPMLFSALRIASTTAVIGAVVGEWIGADKGLGALIIRATFNYQSELLYATIVMSALLAIGLFAIVVAVERYVLRYEH